MIVAQRLIVFACTTLGLFAGKSYADISAIVSVDATHVRAAMSPLGLGIHTSPYYNALSNALVDDRLEEAGVTALRYGGGGYADVLHWSVARPQWESGITGGGLSPWWGEPNTFGYVGPGSDFGNFVKVLDQVNAGKAVVTVNYGSAMKFVGGQMHPPDFGGQAKEAAAWVAYANADASIYGTGKDIMIGVDQQGNDWKTAGYWAKLRASTSTEYQAWSQADGVFNTYNSFLAINRDAPVGIQHWEIGNETFGAGYYRGGNGYSVDYDVPYNGTNRDDHVDLSPAQYGQEVVAYAQLMKSIDPSIKIGAVLATPPDDYSWSYADLNDNGVKNTSESYWNDEVLSQPGIANNVDFVIAHWYPWAGNPLMDEDADGQNDDMNTGATLLAYPRQKISRMIDGATTGLDSGTNRGIRDSLQAHGLPDAEIMITEFRYNNPENIHASFRSAADSLFVADAYASWLELGVASVHYLEMMGKDFLDDDMTRKSAFYGVSMVDKLAKPGDQYVTATTTNNNVRTHAALRADGSLAVMLLNLDLSNTAHVTVNLANFDADGNGTRYLLTGGLSLTPSQANGLGSSFTASLPSRSIATYVIEPAAVLLGDYDDDGDVDGADLLDWQRNPALGDLADWQARFGTNSLLASSRAVPEPSTLVIMSGWTLIWLLRIK